MYNSAKVQSVLVEKENIILRTWIGQKKNIFIELEYWSKLKLHHNLNVMHIEKNICDSIIGILLNIEGKTKNTIKARKDIAKNEY